VSSVSFTTLGAPVLGGGGGSVREQARRKFPDLGVPQRCPNSDVGGYFRLIGRVLVISIGHASSTFPTAAGFLVTASGFSPPPERVYKTVVGRKHPGHAPLVCRGGVIGASLEALGAEDLDLVEGLFLFVVYYILDSPLRRGGGTST